MSGEVEGDAVEKEVGVSRSVVDADKALEVLIESFCLGIALPAVEVSQNWGGIGPEEFGDVVYLLHFALHSFLGDEHKICLLYLVLPIAVARSDRLVPFPDPQAVFVGFFDLGELLEEFSLSSARSPDLDVVTSDPAVPLCRPALPSRKPLR